MPTLNWIGKNKVVNHHQDVIFKVLEHKYNYKFGIENSELNNSGNKIIHGDNLEALKSILPEYEGKIKCIYIDPPYNTGNEKWVYNDNVNHPKIKKWLGDVVGKQGEDLTRHDKWLCMMYPRIKILHKLLRQDGAIFISIDDNEQASLKLMMDEIFGKNCFVSNIIWQKKTGASDTNDIASITEYIMCYTKQSYEKTNIFSRNKQSYDIKRYKYQDKKYPKRGHFYIDNLDRGGLQYSDSLNFGIRCPDGSLTFPNGRSEFINDGWIWKWSKNKVEWAIENDFLEIRKSKKKASGWGVYYRNYLNVNNKNQQIERSAPKKNLITNILNADSASNIKKIFGKNIFKYSKPIKLIITIINFLKLDKNSIILDSFAGSGTTAHAVLNLNKEDGGNRKFIMIEMEDYAETITAERVKRVINGYGTGKKAVAGTGGSFDYYELGKPIFKKDKTLNEEIGEQKIREYIYYTETKQHLTRSQDKKYKYLLDIFNNTGYYFYYEPKRLTNLDTDTLNIVAQKSEQYIIYADICKLDKSYMLEKNIIFKKIPRDIKRF